MSSCEVKDTAYLKLVMSIPLPKSGEWTPFLRFWNCGKLFPEIAPRLVAGSRDVFTVTMPVPRHSHAISRMGMKKVGGENYHVHSWVRHVRVLVDTVIVLSWDAKDPIMIRESWPGPETLILHEAPNNHPLRAVGGAWVAQIRADLILTPLRADKPVAFLVNEMALLPMEEGAVIPRVSMEFSGHDCIVWSMWGRPDVRVTDIPVSDTLEKIPTFQDWDWPAPLPKRLSMKMPLMLTNGKGTVPQESNKVYASPFEGPAHGVVIMKGTVHQKSKRVAAYASAGHEHGVVTPLPTESTACVSASFATDNVKPLQTERIMASGRARVSFTGDVISPLDECTMFDGTRDDTPASAKRITICGTADVTSPRASVEHTTVSSTAALTAALAECATISGTCDGNPLQTDCMTVSDSGSVTSSHTKLITISNNMTLSYTKHITFSGTGGVTDSPINGIKVSRGLFEKTGEVIPLPPARRERVAGYRYPITRSAGPSIPISLERGDMHSPANQKSKNLRKAIEKGKGDVVEEQLSEAAAKKVSRVKSVRLLFGNLRESINCRFRPN